MGGGGGSAPTIPNTVPVRASTSTSQHWHVTDSILHYNPFSFGFKDMVSCKGIVKISVGANHKKVYLL